MSADVRDALLAYAREWNAGTADRRQSEIQALLEACRPDRSPMWRWGTFLLLAKSVGRSSPATPSHWLAELTGGGS